MVVAAPQETVGALLALAESENVSATVIGTFGTEARELVLRYDGSEVGRLSMDFVHDGIPMPRRKAIVATHQPQRVGFSTSDGAVDSLLLRALAHPNIASKHWIIRQYDHEVQAGSVVKPLIGPLQRGPSDGAVIRPKLDSFKGVLIACGLAPHIADPYVMAIASIDEAIRNAICVGANLSNLAMLDNFCWPSCDDERTLGALVRACEACYDAAKAFGVPFISGKDSLHNQFTNSETGQVIRIPTTLLISTIGVVDDVRRCVTMDLKSAGNSLYLVRPKRFDLPVLPLVHRAVSEAIGERLVRSCHDVSDGGVLVAAAEMCIASGLGLSLFDQRHRAADWLFEETLASFVVEIPRSRFAEANAHFARYAELEFVALGEVIEQPRMALSNLNGVVFDLPVETLAGAWLGTLDWA
jgi:phosphoribosylformylglycinamidine synthase